MLCVYCNGPTDDGTDEHEACWQRSAAEALELEAPAPDDGRPYDVVALLSGSYQVCDRRGRAIQTFHPLDYANDALPAGKARALARRLNTRKVAK